MGPSLYYLVNWSISSLVTFLNILRKYSYALWKLLSLKSFPTSPQSENKYLSNHTIFVFPSPSEFRKLLWVFGTFHEPLGLLDFCQDGKQEPICGTAFSIFKETYYFFTAGFFVDFQQFIQCELLLWLFFFSFWGRKIFFLMRRFWAGTSFLWHYNYICPDKKSEYKASEKEIWKGHKVYLKLEIIVKISNYCCQPKSSYN